MFTRFLRGKGCHNTQQRRAIVSVFFQEEGHLTIDDLYGLVQRQDPTVGQSTVCLLYTSPGGAACIAVVS